MTDFRALCAELLDELEYQTDWSTAESLKAEARAALADGPAVPEGREPASVTGQPTDKEPTRLRNCPTHGQQPPWAWGCPECVRQLREELAALQQHHPAPVPVPVSERLPAMVTDGLRVAGDCDEQGRCWAGTRVFVDTSGDRDIDYPPSWELREVRAQDDVWLPAHALPIPHQQQEDHQ